jgi:hypothetical protein
MIRHNEKSPMLRSYCEVFPLTRTLNEFREGTSFVERFGRHTRDTGSLIMSALGSALEGRKRAFVDTMECLDKRVIKRRIVTQLQAEWNFNSREAKKEVDLYPVSYRSCFSLPFKNPETVERKFYCSSILLEYFREKNFTAVDQFLSPIRMDRKDELGLWKRKRFLETCLELKNFQDVSETQTITVFQDETFLIIQSLVQKVHPSEFLPILKVLPLKELLRSETLFLMNPSRYGTFQKFYIAAEIARFDERCDVLFLIAEESRQKAIELLWKFGQLFSFDVRPWRINRVATEGESWSGVFRSEIIHHEVISPVGLPVVALR